MAHPGRRTIFCWANMLRVRRPRVRSRRSLCASLLVHRLLESLMHRMRTTRHASPLVLHLRGVFFPGALRARVAPPRRHPRAPHRARVLGGIGKTPLRARSAGAAPRNRASPPHVPDVGLHLRTLHGAIGSLLPATSLKLCGQCMERRIAILLLSVCRTYGTRRGRCPVSRSAGPVRALHTDDTRRTIPPACAPAREGPSMGDSQPPLLLPPRGADQGWGDFVPRP